MIKMHIKLKKIRNMTVTKKRVNFISRKIKNESKNSNI